MARSAWYRTKSASLKRTVEKVPRGTLCEAEASNNVSSHYIKSDESGGPIEILMGYEGCGLWLYHLLWKMPTTSGPVSGIYTHTYKLDVAPPTGGLTIEQMMGVDLSEVFEGCRLNKGTLKVEAGGLMSLSVDVIAETSAGIDTAGSPTFTTNELDVIHREAGTLSYNSGTFTCMSVSLGIDHKLTRRPLLGTAVTADPAPNGFDSIELTAEIEFADATLYAAYLADTLSNVVIVFSGTGSRTITFTLHNCYVKAADIPVNAVGVIKQTVVFVAQRLAAGTQGLIIEVKNTQATALAA